MARPNPTNPGKRHRLNVELDTRLFGLARNEAASRRISVRAVIEAALSERYDPEHAKREEMLVLKELRALRNEVRNVDFGNRIMVEITMQITRNLFQRLPSPTDESRKAGNSFMDALEHSVKKIFTEQTPVLDRFAAALMNATEADFDALAEAMEQAQDPNQ